MRITINLERFMNVTNVTNIIKVPFDYFTFISNIRDTATFKCKYIGFH